MAEINYKEIKVFCDLCGKLMSYEDYVYKHRTRCLSAKYLINKMNEKGIDAEYKDIVFLNKEKFDEIYKKYS